MFLLLAIRLGMEEREMDEAGDNTAAHVDENDAVTLGDLVAEMVAELGPNRAMLWNGYAELGADQWTVSPLPRGTGRNALGIDGVWLIPRSHGQAAVDCWDVHACIGTAPFVCASISAATSSVGRTIPRLRRLTRVRSLPINAAKSASLTFSRSI